MAKKKPAPGGTPALDALATAGIGFTLHSYDHDPAERHFGDETVAALGIDARRIFKTLIARCDRDLLVAVVPVSGQLDLKALATAAGGKKAELAEPAAAQRNSGYVVGGISPLGQRTPLRTVVDRSALEHDTILVSAGRRGMQVELAGADLVALLGAVVAGIGR